MALTVLIALIPRLIPHLSRLGPYLIPRLLLTVLPMAAQLFGQLMADLVEIPRFSGTSRTIIQYLAARLFGCWFDVLIEGLGERFQLTIL